MSAWKPSVFGRSTCSSSSRFRFQLCMPPQQISPSAASRSLNPSATSHASRKVWAIFFVLPAGSFAHSAGLAAESILMTPDVRMPTSRRILPISAGLPHLGDELLALGGIAHRGAAAGWRPDRRHERADGKLPRPNPIGEPLHLVVARVDADVRIEEKQIDAVELDAVDRCVRGEIEHRVEVDRRFRVRSFPDEARPHRVVEGRKPVL